MHTVKDNTHSLVSGDQGTDSEHERNSRQGSPASSDIAQCKDDSNDEAKDNKTNTKTSCKEHTCGVTVADRPADKVGVGLVAKTLIHRLEDTPECRGMSGVRQSLDSGLLLSGGEIQLAGSAIHDVCRNDPVDLLTEGLDRDCSER